MSENTQEVPTPPEPTRPKEVLYYSESVHGFFSSFSHRPEQIPEDAIEITHEEHAALFEGQSQGLTITRPPNGGKPILVDNRPSPEQIATELNRIRRNMLLGATVDKITVVRLSMLTDQEKSDMMAYRQALLDVPSQSGFPMNIVWPEVPSFLVTPEVTAIMDNINKPTLF